MAQQYDDRYRRPEWARHEGRDRERQRETSQPYGQREPYNPRDPYGRGRSGEGSSMGYGRESRYGESQYGQRGPSSGGREYGGGGYRSSEDQFSRGTERRPSRYGSGDFGYGYGGTRGEPQFGGEGPFGESESPRLFGTGYYGEGGTHYTGGYDQRGDDPGYSRGDYDYERHAGARGSSGTRYGEYGSGQSRRGERPGGGVMQRMFKRGPKGYQRSDERLREDISERLMQADNVDSSEVTVNVVAGKVTLDGTVPNRYMKHAIEDLVDECPGVQDIENRIRVDSNFGQSMTGSTSSQSSTAGQSSGTSFGASGSSAGGSSTTGSNAGTTGSNAGRRKE
jgi:hypothetical protein